MTASFQSLGKFPKVWKEAVVKPLLKKQGLEPDYKNYRPVSKLHFISKMLEKVVATQIISKIWRLMTY